MNLWKNLLILAAAICLVSPVAVPAFDEAPSFSSPAQVQRAQNLAGLSVSEEDAKSSIDLKEVEAKADSSAEDYVLGLANQYADGVVEDEENIEKYKEAALLYLNNYIESEADSYAAEKCLTENCTEKDIEAYRREIRDRVDTDRERQQLYETELRRITEEERLNAYNYAYDRATGEGYKNAKQTARDKFYVEEYEKALAEQIALATDTQLELITQKRLEGKGWGVIFKELGIESKFSGLGHFKKMGVNEPEPDMPAPNLEVLSLDAEIEQVTTRNRYENNVRNRNQVLTKQKANSKKWIGLDEASLKAQAAVSDVGEDNGKSSNGKGGSSVGAGKSNNSNKSQTSLSSTSSPSGKEKSNNGNNGRSSNSSKSDKNDRGNNSNSGKSDKNDRGNSGNNGNNGKGKK